MMIFFDTKQSFKDTTTQAQPTPYRGFENTNWNNDTKQKFFNRLADHVNSSDVWQYSGNYRGTEAMHYLNPRTRQWVATSLNGDLLAAWKLYPSQVSYLINFGYVK